MGRLVINGEEVYELDEECLKEKNKNKRKRDAMGNNRREISSQKNAAGKAGKSCGRI